ncbi:hypothetical protein SEA_GREKAYCON_40 [Arthrobacter phage Grekaycon]|uniref:Uncharacterized protein n=4 Tax=root TaxID=1 RepID=A0A514A5I2_9CAUD|nr:hypothetical protein TAEYOUNG_40 [Arthrobacter phage TaeYoung]QDH48530.1 hypothetical protein SEA_GREKAYCON_40 [Arthrobacter phage Grekaycon]QED11778.1 hypothetical protein SEA_BOSSLADY_40 [Arthrobacter phage BossLady]
MRVTQMHKINKEQAVALTKLVVSLQPGWAPEDFMQELGRHREQDDFPRFVSRIVEGALMGEAIEDAFILPPAHMCPVTDTPDEAWLRGEPSVSVVNEHDISQSKLLSKPKLDTPAARPPNDDPNNWRNRFAREIDKGKQQRQADLLKNRADAPEEQTRCLTPSTRALVNSTLSDLADSFAPPQHHDDQGYYPESATAVSAERQGVPTHDVVTPDAEVPPVSRFAAMTQPTETDEERKEREARAHRKMLLAAQAKRDKEQSGYSGRNAGWSDHNPDK